MECYFSKLRPQPANTPGYTKQTQLMLLCSHNMQVYLIFTLHSTNPIYITTHVAQTTPCKKKQVLEETLTLLALIVILVLSSPLEVVPTPAHGERYVHQIPDSQQQC
jgi:archaellum biogenesis protein FlaJ (TadC family)